MANTGAVIVTGGSRGIGAAICRKLAGNGVPVVVNYSGSADAARKVVEAIEAAGGRAVAFQANVADERQVASMFEAAVDKLGPLGGLVNNAGVLGDAKRLDEHDLASMTPIFAVNVFGAVLCAKEAVRRLSTKHGGAGGSIVSISSVAARSGGIPGMSVYAASKGAIESLTRALANEVAREGIRVNAVSPGMIETDMTTDVAQKVAPLIPMGRCGQPDEIADVVAWLMSGAASYVTGSIVTASGGR